MRKYGLVIIFGICLLSCWRNSKIEGIWKCNFVNPLALQASDILFTDMHLYEEGNFEPIIEFTDRNMRYDLGFGKNDFNFEANYCKYRIGNGLIRFCCNQKEQIFSIDHHTNAEFCLYLGEAKVACFEKVLDEAGFEKLNYYIELKIIGYLYEIDMKLSCEGTGIITRKGEVSDTTIISLNNKDAKHIASMVRRINSSTFRMEDHGIGGDHAFYYLKLVSNDNIYVGKAEGLMEASFETKALIINLENLIIRTFGPEKIK